MWMLGRLLASALALGGTHATGSFEYVAFTPPPAWLVSHAEGGRQYVRHEPSGTGLVKLLPSEPTTRDAGQVFADTWRVHATRIHADHCRTTTRRPTGAPAGELGFDVPPGYMQQRNGDLVVLAPAAVDERTPCLYGIAAPRAATGNLEADAGAALLQSVVPGWRRLDDRHYAMRGTSAAGWPCVRCR